MRPVTGPRPPSVSGDWESTGETGDRGSWGEEAVVRALQSARRPPAGSLSRLTWRQLAEATVGTLESASIDIDLLEAAAAPVLCGANRFPVPLAPMLKAHGQETPTAIDRVGADLGLLASGEAAPGQPATLPPRPCPIPRAVGGGCQVWSAPGPGAQGIPMGAVWAVLGRPWLQAGPTVSAPWSSRWAETRARVEKSGPRGASNTS